MSEVSGTAVVRAVIDEALNGGSEETRTLTASLKSPFWDEFRAAVRHQGKQQRIALDFSVSPLSSHFKAQSDPEAIARELLEFMTEHPDDVLGAPGLRSAA
jgi:hypothetical protein